jgi:uroporphyrinogen-III synthase
MKKVFISRNLAASSCFYQDEFKSVQLTAQSLLTIESVTCVKPQVDWLFFYSKSGIDCYNEQHPLVNNEYLIGCFGPQTAAYLEKQYRMTPHFVGTGEAHSCLEKWKNSHLNGSICFIRGEHSKRSLIDELAAFHSIRELIVYRQTIRKINKLGHYDLAILTSPLNVASFFQNKGSAQVFLAIGSTTAQALISHGILPTVAEEPSEAALAESAKHILGIKS